jgi:hypothetical protein
MIDQANAGTNDQMVEAEELIALIKAIKFAYPDYGCKRVHDQIMTHEGKYTKVPLKRVKKYMQKLGMTNAQVEYNKNLEVNEDGKTKSNVENIQSKVKATQNIELMTVGGQSKSQRPKTSSEFESEKNLQNVWKPVKLDEPATKITKFPYQAVIRMTHNEEGDASGEMGEIYKIQVALGFDGKLSKTDPMLVYNKARNRKTFLHPDSPAYTPVQTLIAGSGQSGMVGGSKAYFWGKYAKEKDMLYINVEKLAPFQKW